MIKFWNIRIRYQIAIMFSVIIIIVSSIISYIYYQNTYDNITSAFYNRSTDNIIQKSDFFDQQIKDIVEKLYAIKYDPNVNSILRDYLINDGYYSSISAVLNITFSNLEITEDFVSSVYIHTPKGDFFEYADIKRLDFVFEESELYEQIKSVNRDLYIGHAGNDQIFKNQNTVIPIMLKFKVDGYNEELYLIINLDCDNIQTSLKNTITGPGHDLFIINKSKQMVLESDTHVAIELMNNQSILDEIITTDSGIKTRQLDGKRYIEAHRSLNVVPWVLVSLQSEDALTADLNDLKKLVVIVTILAMVSAIMVAMFISNRILEPIKMLNETMDRVTKGDFNVKVVYPYENEVGKLGESFNYMTTEIKSLITGLEKEKDKVQLQQKLKRTAEIKALQAQINPHFLYNTLNAIIWLAHDINAVEIGLIASDLGEFYRIALSKGKEIITIKDELEHVKKYLSIQSIRYKEQLTYEFVVDEGMYNQNTIKLILQPLVENALYHGIKNRKDNNGTIKIILKYDLEKQCIVMNIRDNGPGMTPETLDMINQKLKETFTPNDKVYGLFNVNERIRLAFGNDFGVELESELGKGTNAIIQIPFNQEDIR